MPDLYAQNLKKSEKTAKTQKAAAKKKAQQNKAEKSREANLAELAGVGRMTPAQAKSILARHGNLIGDITQSLYGKRMSPDKLNHHELMQVIGDAQWRLGHRAEALGVKPPTQQVPLNLGAALSQAEQPYTRELSQLVSQAPSLSGYLKNVPSGLAQILQQGYGNLQGDAKEMNSAIENQAKYAGQAGMLQDLLNAARYQAIYKQQLYGQAPPTSSPLGQLYQQVVTGGNALAGPGLNAVNPKNAATPQGAPPRV